MLKVGIIGLGVGESHIEGYKSHPGCEVNTICDFSDEVLERVSKAHPHLKTTTSANDVLTDSSIDLVSIASYDNFHYEQIITAIENGKHIFVEKPLCMQDNEAKHIWELLSKFPKIQMSSNLILRLTPRFNLLKDKIERGELGSIYFIEGDYNYGRLHKIIDGWRGKMDFYSSVCGGGVHLIDMFLWLTQDVVEEVSAIGNNISTKGTGFRYNDMTVAILKFRSGIVAKMSVNLGSVTPHFHPFSVYGTKGTFMSHKQTHASYHFSRDPVVQADIVEDDYPGTSKGDLIYNFVDSISGNTEPYVSKDDVFNAISVCLAIDKAVAFNGTVKVEYLTA